MRLVIPCLICLATPAAALAADPEGASLHGSVRLRIETIDGQARAATPPGETLLVTRSIVQARYRVGRITFGGDLIDSRAIAPMARTAATTTDVNAFEQVQLFVAADLGDPKAKTLHGRLTIGRQVADVASRRLLANDDYRNTTNGFTGARLDLAGMADATATLFYLLPQQRLPDDLDGVRAARVRLDREGFDTRIWGATLARPVGGRVALDVGAVRFEERDRPGRATRDRQLTTLTARITAPVAPGHLDTEIEVMRQTGSIAASIAPGAARKPVAAWFGHATVGYQWPTGWKPHVAVDADYASGDRRTGTYERFDSLFGFRRADYAPSGLYNAVQRDNLIAVGPRLQTMPSKRLDTLLTVKKLWLASPVDGFATTGVVDANGRSGRDAGWQVDSRLRFFTVPRRFMVEADGVWLAKGRFLRTAPNRASRRDTVYAALAATAFF